METWVTTNGIHIWHVLSGRINSFLVRTPEGITVLVDTGMRTACKKLIRTIESAGITEINYLLLSHSHFDHCRNASFLKDKYGCKILVHHSEAPFTAKGYTTIPGGTNPFTRLISPLGKAIGKRGFGYPAFEPDLLLDETSTDVFCSCGLRLICTPGHCSGSVSLIINHEIAIVGDALFGGFPNRVLSPFADDKIELIRSWKRLLDTGCKLFLSGHGRPITRNLLEREYSKYSPLTMDFQ